MPRSAPIPDREREICARFREARLRAGYKQAALARAIGIQPDRLAGYEHGRNSVPYWIGNEIAAKTDTCQRWLYDATLPVRPFHPVDETVQCAVPRSAFFSAVYESLLKGKISRLIKDVAKVAKQAERELEPHSFDGWSSIWAPPMQCLFDAISVRLDGMRLLAFGLTEDGLIKLGKELDDISSAMQNGKLKRNTPGSWSQALEPHRAVLTEHLRTLFGKYLTRQRTLQSGKSDTSGK